jgi:hypothetical protein
MPRFLRQRNLGHNRSHGRNEEEAKPGRNAAKAFRETA